MITIVVDKNDATSDWIKNIKSPSEIESDSVKKAKNILGIE